MSARKPCFMKEWTCSPAKGSQGEGASWPWRWMNRICIWLTVISKAHPTHIYKQPCYRATLQGRSHAQQWLTNTKWAQSYFGFVFFFFHTGLLWIFLSYWSFNYLGVFLFICLIFSFCGLKGLFPAWFCFGVPLFRKERENIKLGVLKGKI